MKIEIAVVKKEREKSTRSFLERELTRNYMP